MREKLERAEQTTHVFARPDHFAHLPAPLFSDWQGIPLVLMHLVALT